MKSARLTATETEYLYSTDQVQKKVVQHSRVALLMSSPWSAATTFRQEQFSLHPHLLLRLKLPTRVANVVMLQWKPIRQNCRLMWQGQLTPLSNPWPGQDWKQWMQMWRFPCSFAYIPKWFAIWTWYSSLQLLGRIPPLFFFFFNSKKSK